MQRIICLTVFLMNSVTSLQAQGQWVWPNDTSTAREKVAMYDDYMKAGQLAESVLPLQWLLTHAPDLNPSIYINGIKIYEGLAATTEHDSLRSHYQQRVIDLIDTRQAIFGETKGNKIRKAYYGYKFWSRTGDKHAQVHQWFLEAHHATNGDIGDHMIPAMMHMICKTQTPEASFTWYLRFVQQIDAVRLPQLNRIAFSCLDWSCEAVALLWEQRSRA
ncbi:MAG: hypothetical protein AAGA85_21575, partial [Bacteroidota bacterium]